MLQIQKLNFKSSVLPITSDSLFYKLVEGPEMGEVCERFEWKGKKRKIVTDICAWVKSEGPLGEPLIFSHGDYHPRNIMVRDGQIIPIDWEKAGYHSIFQDVYALIHMCYPESEASLLPSEQNRLLTLFRNELSEPAWMEGYSTFVLLICTPKSECGG